MIPIDPLIAKMVSFIEEIGLIVRFGKIDVPSFLPGLYIDKGSIIIDLEKLSYPGDILHEAGHLAVVAPARRATMNGNLANEKESDGGEELMAIAWSYAACLEMGIDPAVVFHKDGYKGGAQNILDNFSAGRYFGVPMLQWIGLTIEPHKAKDNGTAGYPKMIKWVNDSFDY